MAKSEVKVHLVHGDCDYLVFKEFKSIKKQLEEKQVSVSEFFGSKQLYFDQIQGALGADDLFMSSTAVVVRNVNSERSFFPFVEEMTEFLNASPELQNDLYIFNYSKVPKTARLYKAVSKVGEVKELNIPKQGEVVDMIKKSLPITDDAAHLLFEFTASNLFQIKNEIEKLKCYVTGQGRDKVTIEDVKEVCVPVLSQNDIWGIGAKFLRLHINDDPKLRTQLMEEIEDLFKNEIAAMQILYSFYQYVLSALKFTMAFSQGSIRNERDAFSYGYFFVKEFYSERSKFKLEDLFALNARLLDTEFKIKSGELDEKLGIRSLMLPEHG